MEDRPLLPRAPQSPQAPDASRESGVVLVLALLVMMILIVVVAQIFHSSQVDLRRAENQAIELQMEKLSIAAMLKAYAALISDLDEDLAAAQEEEGGAPPDQGGGGGTLAPPGGAGGGTGGVDAPHVDSLDEVWAMGDFPFELGDLAELETKIMIEDEDSKMNLLLLATQDPEYRLLWRDRFVRLLDLLRDGQEDDLSVSEAEVHVERLEKWLRGERENDLISKAPLADGPFVDDDSGEEFYAPLSLGELMLSGGIEPSLMYGFLMGEDEDAEWVPGLDRVLSVLSNLEFDESAVPPPPGEEELTDDLDEDEEDEDETDEPENEAPGVNNGRINVNTAPIQVLKALLPDDELPASAWEEFEEFRAERLEELLEDPEAFFEDQEEDELNATFSDGPIYPLESVEDLRRFDSFSESNSFLDPETWRRLSSLLTVESNVFTVTVVVGTRSPPHRYYVARSVVWRRNGEDGAEVVPVLPFERLPNQAIDLSKFEEELREDSDWGF